jgi:hypothetical protein
VLVPIALVAFYSHRLVIDFGYQPWTEPDYTMIFLSAGLMLFLQIVSIAACHVFECLRGMPTIQKFGISQRIFEAACVLSAFAIVLLSYSNVPYWTECDGWDVCSCDWAGESSIISTHCAIPNIPSE